MTPTLLLPLIVDPTLGYLRTLGIKSDARARVMLLAIAGQESGCCNRYQVVSGGGKGPARGFWQFERGGGVAGVLQHHSSRVAAATACRDLLIPATPAAVHEAIEQNDVLACVFARLLLLTDAAALPSLPQDGWAYYLRNWRPGKPHPTAWAGWWRQAFDIVAAVETDQARSHSPIG